MRRLLATAASLAVLASLVLGVALVWLPRFVNGDPVRRRVESAAREALGREVRYARLDVGWLPPSLVIVEPSLTGDDAAGPPLVTARELALEIELAPLLSRRLVIHSVVVGGATLRLTRTPQGLGVPPLAVGGPARERAAGRGPSLSLRSVELRDAVLVLVDRVLEPPLTWRFPRADGSLRSGGDGEPFRVELDLALEGGGRLATRGSASLDGRVDLVTRLEAFPLARIAPYLEAASALEGRVSGTLSQRGSATDPDRIGIDLALADGTIRIDPIEIVGRMTLDAFVEGGLSSAAGRFEVDATDARVRYQEVYDKPPGKPARVRGRIVPGRGGRLDLDDVRLVVHDREAPGRAEIGPRPRLDADASGLPTAPVPAPAAPHVPGS